MDKVKELEANIERYKTIANTLKVDLNMRDARIRALERELAAARREIRSLEVGTQTMQKLEILGDSDDDNGVDPRATGTFKSPWERAR